MRKRCFALAALILSYLCIFESAYALSTPFQSPSKQIERTEISLDEQSKNFGTIYFSQWIFYYLTQKENIEKYGSFENWYKYPWNPRFDRDSFGYNILQHSFAGTGYYLFYRSRGYNKFDSFTWSAISSLTFEFTIETVTEHPSFQDLYQTPVYGTIFGIAAEHMALYLVSSPYSTVRFFAYILNPFMLFPDSSYEFHIQPTVDHETVGAQISWRFE